MQSRLSAEYPEDAKTVFLFLSNLFLDAFFLSNFLPKVTHTFLTSSTRVEKKPKIKLKTLWLLLPQVNHCLKLCFRGLQIEDRLNEPGVIGAPRALHFAPINCVCRSVKVQGSLPGYEERVQKVLFAHKFLLDSLHFMSLDDLSSWPESTDTLFGDWWHFTCWNLPHLRIKGSIFVCQGKEQVYIEGPGAAKVSQVCVSTQTSFLTHLCWQK